jgi:hypothetical protein
MRNAASIDGCSVPHPPQHRSQPLPLRTPKLYPVASAPASISSSSVQPLARPTKSAAVARVALQVTILPALFMRLQQAVSNLCGDSVEILAVEPLPHNECLRVRFGVDGGCIDAAMAVIIGVLPSGEIGRLAAL